MAPAPWDGVPSEDLLFVLVTGANSGIGLGIAQRLIDEFLEQRPLSSHLVVITTTRSARKSRETLASLRRHLERTARSPRIARAIQRRSPAPASSYDPRGAVRRVHLAGVELDLCDLPSVYRAAAQLVRGTVDVVTGAGAGAGGGGETVGGVRLPRLDALVCNAGIGGWTGLDWWALATSICRYGLVQATTYPTCKGAEGGLLVDPLTGKGTTLREQEQEQERQRKDGNEHPEEESYDGRLLGQVFCANVFGHYVLAHELLPLLGRGAGRVVWESSVEAVQWRLFSPDDFQGLRTPAAYESSKRLTDVLSLTADLPGVRAVSAPFFEAEEEEEEEEGEDGEGTPAGRGRGRGRARMYLTHPGVVCTPLFPLSFVLFWLYNVAMYISRWLGSPWHPVTPYAGACAAVWAALQPQEALDALGAEHVKWGSSCDRLGGTAVKKTEVEGWGWEGRVEDAGALARDPAAGLLRRAVGRKAGAVDLTPERREEFERLGALCWREMERLRLRWQGILGVHGGKGDSLEGAAKGHTNGNGAKKATRRKA